MRITAQSNVAYFKGGLLKNLIIQPRVKLKSTLTENWHLDRHELLDVIFHHLEGELFSVMANFDMVCYIRETEHFRELVNEMN